MSNKNPKSKFQRKPLDYAFFLLGIRDQSTGELNDKMQRKGYEKVEIDETIKVLKEKKFLDDKRFVENLIRQKLEIGNFGRQRIWQDLKKKFIANELIEESLSNIEKDDEEESAKEAMKAFIRKRGEPKEYKEKQKLIAYLGRRGFSWEIIEKILNTNT